VGPAIPLLSACLEYASTVGVGEQVPAATRGDSMTPMRSGTRIGCPAQAVTWRHSMLTTSSWIVMGGILAIVLCGTALFLVAIWLEKTGWWESAPVGFGARPASTDASGRGHTCGGLGTRSDIPMPDLRIYAVLRAAWKVHRLPALPQPRAAARLLADTGDPSGAGRAPRPRTQSRRPSPARASTGHHPLIELVSDVGSQ
jgi:hypothetical protein